MRVVRAAIGAEHDVGGGHREVVGVVLADAEEVDADLVGEHALLDDAADRLRVGERPAAVVVDQVAERVEAEDEWELGLSGCLGHRASASSSVEAS